MLCAPHTPELSIALLHGYSLTLHLKCNNKYTLMHKNAPNIFSYPTATVRYNIDREHENLNNATRPEEWSSAPALLFRRWRTSFAMIAARWKGNREKTLTNGTIQKMLNESTKRPTHRTDRMHRNIETNRILTAEYTQTINSNVLNCSKMVYGRSACGVNFTIYFEKWKKMTIARTALF